MPSRSPIMHNLDGVEFRLAEPTDLSFIQQYGSVFRVFDDHDSGNISFGRKWKQTYKKPTRRMPSRFS